MIGTKRNKIGFNGSTKNDKFSKIFFFGVPFLIPLIVAGTTFIFYPITQKQNLIWLPLLLIYWGTIWILTGIYLKKRGGIFTSERFKLTIKLKGKYLWLQYLLTYGPLTYAIPLFIVKYGLNTSITAQMFLLLLFTSIINGPSEEIYWRACLDEAGKNAGISQRNRLIFAPIAFSLWHTAFVVHLFPWNLAWFTAWGAILLMTWSSGFIWMWVLHRSGRLVPQCIYHACANFFNIFPLLLIDILNFYL